MAANGLQYFLLLILLVFSQLISFNAVPTSGIRNLLHESQYIPSYVNTHQRVAMETGEEDVIVITNKGRMELENKEYNIDYEGPSANGHHTPKPPSLRG
ncbi:hypothetical protein LguiA_000384 [Lonicera macranthoides]